MRTLWQRFGRGARNFALNATAILFAEAKWFDDERAKRAAAHALRKQKNLKRAADGDLTVPSAKRARKPAAPQIYQDVQSRGSTPIAGGSVRGTEGRVRADGDDDVEGIDVELDADVGEVGEGGDRGSAVLVGGEGDIEEGMVEGDDECRCVGGLGVDSAELDAGDGLPTRDVVDVRGGVEDDGAVDKMRVSGVENRVDGRVGRVEGQEVGVSDPRESCGAGRSGETDGKDDQTEVERARVDGTVVARSATGEGAAVRDNRGLGDADVSIRQKKAQARDAHHTHLSSIYDKARRATVSVSRTQSKKHAGNGDEVEELTLELDNLMNARTRPHHCFRVPILAWFKAHLTSEFEH